MGDHIRRGEEFEKKADKKINGWVLLGSKYEDAADLLTQSANQFKLAKSCINPTSLLFFLFPF
jgi:alpha-soluble NSF attachment protein